MGNSLSSSSKKALIRAKLKPGNIIHIFCDFINNPKNKFCVIVHADFQEDYILFFFVNSEISPFIQKNEAMNRCQLDLKQEDYPFFSKPVSYLNCAELHDELDVEFVIDHLLRTPEDYKGMLLEKEIEEIIQIVNDTKTIGDHDKNLIFNSLGN
ncbi:hypothetical protein IMZ68_01705 [Candidatus Bathyarchaeota archaeon]|nr:hypothetical protein [Candidatus Bathyarchaeota archaeon]